MTCDQFMIIYTFEVKKMNKLESTILEDPGKRLSRSGSNTFVSLAAKSISKVMITHAGSLQPLLTAATRPTAPTASCLPSSQ